MAKERASECVSVRGAQSIKVIFYEASFMRIFTIKFSHYYFYYFRYSGVALSQTVSDSGHKAPHERRYKVLFRILTQFYSLQWWSKPSEIVGLRRHRCRRQRRRRRGRSGRVDAAKPHPILWSPSPSSQPFQFIICLSATNIMSPIVQFSSSSSPPWNCIVIERIKWPEVQKRTSGGKYGNQ